MSNQGTDRPPTGRGDGAAPRRGLPRRQPQAGSAQIPSLPAAEEAFPTPKAPAARATSVPNAQWTPTWASKQQVPAADQIQWHPISPTSPAVDSPPVTSAADKFTPAPGPDPFAPAPGFDAFGQGPDMFASAPLPRRTEVEAVDAEPVRRRRWLPWVVVAAGVVIVGGIAGVIVVGGSSDTRTATPPTVTVTAPEPTPSTSPINRGAGSELWSALPGTVRQYVLTTITPVTLTGTFATATEAYSLIYEGTAADGTPAVIQVTVGQWVSPEAATAAAAPVLVAAGTPFLTGQVEVVGAITGSFSLFGEPVGSSQPTAPAQVSGEAPVAGSATRGSAVWTNGTLFLQAEGPTAEIANIYRAFAF